jgi:hypothetical protein
MKTEYWEMLVASLLKLTPGRLVCWSFIASTVAYTKLSF